MPLIIPNINLKFKKSTVASRFIQIRPSFHPYSFHTTSTPTQKLNSSSHQHFHLLFGRCSTEKEFKQLHAQIVLRGVACDNHFISKLVSFFAVSNYGDLRYAQRVFDNISEPNRCMYNSLIRGYSNSNDREKAVALYRQMIHSGILPNEFTLPFALKACAFEAAYWEAVVIQGHAVKLGFGSQVIVQNALINLYAVCGLITSARRVFDDMNDKTAVSWNSIIGGYTQMGCSKEAFLLFREMREYGVQPDRYTFVNLLSVCAQTGDLEFGRCVHLHVEVTGVEIDLHVWNSLIDMYAKCRQLQTAEAIFLRIAQKNVVSWTSMVYAYAREGFLDFAKKVFDQMPVKNVVSWNSMISCCVQNGQSREALDLFGKMCASQVVPDEVTLVAVTSACGHLGDLVSGIRVHDYIHFSNIKPSVSLYNSLIDMYTKCGSVKTALDIFYKMPEKDVVSWNVVIAAHALHGLGLEAIEFFENMQIVGIRPDKITFTALLSACSHNGLVESGHHYFENISAVFGVTCDIEHYACMIDLLGRVGLVEEAIRLIGRMPMKPDVVIWGSLLGTCRNYGNVEVGKCILKHLLGLEHQNGGLYVLLSNIFCEAQRWEDVRKIRKLIKDYSIEKGKAISSVEIGGRIVDFIVDDKRHQISASIYTLLDGMTDHLKSFGDQCYLSSAFLNDELV